MALTVNAALILWINMIALLIKGPVFTLSASTEANAVGNITTTDKSTPE